MERMFGHGEKGGWIEKENGGYVPVLVTDSSDDGEYEGPAMRESLPGPVQDLQHTLELSLSHVPVRH